MIRYYTLKQEINPIYYVDDKTLEEINNHKSSFLACCSLLYDYFHLNHFIILLIDKEYDKQKNSFKSIFKVSNKKVQYYLEINNDTCTIRSDNIQCTWTIWDNECELIELTEKLGEKTVTQAFSPHGFKIEVKINDKIWRMDIPIDIYSTFDLDFFDRIIKDITRVEDLKRIYQQYFYNEQKNYDRVLETKISFSKIYDEQEMLMDELVIKNGKIISYLFSNCKGNIILSNKNGVIEIRNCSLDEQIDLNGEVINLLKRGKKQS